MVVFVAFIAWAAVFFVSVCRRGVCLIHNHAHLRFSEPNSTFEEKEAGRQRSEALSQMTSQFILRRTADINQAYLPDKGMHISFGESFFELLRYKVTKRFE